MLTDGLKKVDHKGTAKPEVEMTPVERGEDVVGAEGAPARLCAKTGESRMEVALTDATRKIIMPLIANALEGRRVAALAEDRLSDAAIGIAACAGFELAQGTRFEFKKGDDGKFTSIVWDAKS